ncbi:MAG: hypothetical protein GC178_16090 [Flavobacteriales bacterium]|nr:hypothetical protein [Flavobacteriales bacterium]
MSNVKVKIWSDTVGYLTWDANSNTSIFELDNAYREADYNLSPLLLDKRQRLHYGGAYNELFVGLPPMIADSLPDAFGNRVFQEWLIQNNYHLQDLNPVDRLMYVANRGVGALEYEPGKEVMGAVSEVDFTELANVSKKIIENKYAFSDFVSEREALQHILSIGSSVGGAQAKVLVAVNSATGEIRAGDVCHADTAFTYHIVKLAYDTDTPWGKEKTSVEYVYWQMAQQAGLGMMPSELLEVDGSFHFKTQRYDRVNGKKVHTQTLAGLTGYSDRTVPFSYEQLFGIMERLQVSHRDKERLFKQMVFNVAACNMDDHLKNFSFVMESNGGWRLSPAYDITYPFDPYKPSMKFHKLTINGKSKEIGRGDVLAVAKKVGIRNAKNVVDGICVAVSGFAQFAKETAIGPKTIHLIEKDIEQRIALLQN